MGSFLDVFFCALIPTFIMCLAAAVLSSKKKSEVMDSPLGLAIIVLFELPRFVMALLPQPTLGLPSLAAWIIGGAIFLLAMTFAGLGVCQIRMGALKLPNKEGKLQTTGIYGVVRHPIYFGDAFWPLGWSIMFDAGYSLMFSPLWLIILFLFSSVEEKRLAEEYGNEYEKYKQRVSKRIIPGII
jgi:protein-S-isoprenylcysteine O-methyltransferase Ste14